MTRLFICTCSVHNYGKGNRRHHNPIQSNLFIKLSIYTGYIFSQTFVTEMSFIIAHIAFGGDLITYSIIIKMGGGGADWGKIGKNPTF